MVDRNTAIALKKMQQEDRADLIAMMQPLLAAMQHMAQRIDWLEAPWYKRGWRWIVQVYRNFKGLVGVVRFKLKNTKRSKDAEEKRRQALIKDVAPKQDAVVS